MVNDNYFLLKMLTDILEDFFDVLFAQNGLEALDIVIGHQRNYFDAIVMDINMPVMDGLESCKKINQHLFSSTMFQIALAQKGNRTPEFKKEE